MSWKSAAAFIATLSCPAVGLAQAELGERERPQTPPPAASSTAGTHNAPAASPKAPQSAALPREAEEASGGAALPGAPAEAEPGTNTPDDSEIAPAGTPGETASPKPAEQSPAPYAEWRSDQSFGGPTGMAPVQEAAPLVANAEFARKPWELSLTSTLIQKLCATNVDRCDNSPGFGLSTALMERPSPSFGWGLRLQYGQFTEAWQHRQLALEQKHRTLGGLIFGRVFTSDGGRIDPFVELGIGAGQFKSDTELRMPDQALTQEQSSLAPIYQATLGVDVHLTEQLRAGGVFTWTHWLLSDYERCGNVAGGVCTLPNANQFSLENAVWKLGVRLSAPFGDPL